MDYTIDKERSLRTTKLFVNGLANIGAVNISTLPEENMKLKRAINRCVDYINRRGGFTVIGTIYELLIDVWIILIDEADLQ
jgi:hypothetical protein